MRYCSFRIAFVTLQYESNTDFTKPEHWDSKKRWIKRACPNYDEIDACLIRITSKLGEILTYAKINGISPTVDFVLLELKKNRE